jgi:hypothetical protein
MLPRNKRVALLRYKSFFHQSKDHYVRPIAAHGILLQPRAFLLVLIEIFFNDVRFAALLFRRRLLAAGLFRGCPQSLIPPSGRAT